MTKFLFAFVALAMSTIAPAMAADVNAPIKAPAIAATPAGLWHIGLSGFDSVLRDGHLMPAGAGAGANVGYDFVNGPWLFGWELEGRYENIAGTATCALIVCTSRGTWGGSLTGRIGVTFAGLNAWLGNQPTFVNFNSRLAQPFVPVTALNSASIYLKGGLDVRHLQSGLAGMSESINDVGLVLGAGIEAPVYNSMFWRTEVLWDKYNDALCGGCTLPGSRPSVWTVKSGLDYKFSL